MKTSAETRQAYLDFFAARKHVVRPSTSLIPQGDATLMFNSAGMVPFKPYFLGIKTDLSRAASCQKCFRTTDIDRVGTTVRHCTFFEMLGNFSFGDYFKKDAIAWAWEFLIKDIGFDPKRLHPTVYKDDDEAFALWEGHGVPNKPVRLGEESNFWNMGPTGPCGPCSEIYFDRGPQFACERPNCGVGCDCDRYLEIWNLVFTQFDRQADGLLKPLPRKNIDTGMGLERLGFAAQDKLSPFDTDLFAPVVQTAAHILSEDPRRSKETELAFRVIADHSRAAVMLMSEGVIPSNVERGYVLRRLIRRAVRYGQLLGYEQPFLHRLVPAVLEIYEKTYPELHDAAPQVASALKTEEEKFLETLQNGERELKALLETTGQTLSGEQAFKLYETFGFPLELTREIAGQGGVSVDEAGFARAAEKASEVARASWKGSGEKNLQSASLRDVASTAFSGYEKLEEATTVAAYDAAQGLLALASTPFYAEGGGQVGDTGEILSEGGKVLAKVEDTQKQGKVYVHLVAPGSPLSVGQKVLARVDARRRARIRPHHTATHLMNEALKRVLGSHVRQAGSYVGPDKLRFDFTHPKALTQEDLAKIETTVNEEIRAAHPVVAKEHPVAMVKEFGAVTLLGEDYGESPRFLLVGPKGWQDPKDRFSLELCGGTHVSNTAEILGFKIVKESSAAAGVRRIEAVAGEAVKEYEAERAAAKQAAASQLEARENALIEGIAVLGSRATPSKTRDEASLRASIKALESQVGSLKSKKLAAQAEAGKRVLQINGFKLLAQRLEGADPKSLRAISDKAKTELGSGLVFLAAPGGGKLSFVLAVTPDLANKVDAAKIAKAFAAANGGSAGGRADFAQGGCSDSDWEGLLSALAGCLK